MTSKKEKEREALLVELELHKIEFSTLRQEILQLIESQRQYLNWSLVTVGAGLGLSTFIAGPDSVVVLLLFPFVFHILLWEMLKSFRSIIWTSGYLLKVLIPRVNYIVNELGQSDPPVHVLGWEEYISSHNFLTKEERILSIFSPSGNLIPVLAVGVLVISFLIVSDAYGHVPTGYELGLIFINLFLLVLAVIQNIFLNRSGTFKAKISR